MTPLIAAGLLLGSLSTPSAGIAVEHRTRLDHPAGAVEARYRGDVAIVHRQIGTVAPGGRPSTLRCLWSAGLSVDRRAHHGSGDVMTRSIRRDAVVEGHRPGWCAAHRDSIAREVAGRGAVLRDHLIAIAREDHGVLHAELDQRATRTG